MDCRTVSEHLEIMTAPEREAVAGEVAEHLHHCPDCRFRADRQARFDRQLQRALQTVDIPNDLKARLLVCLESESVPRIGGADRSTRPAAGSSRRGNWLLAGLALCLLVGLVTFSWWQPSPAPSLDYVAVQQTLAEQFRRDLSAWESLEEFDGSFEAHFDRELLKLRVSSAHGIDLDGDDRHDVAVYQFSLGRWSGVLVVLPHERLDGRPEQTSPRLVSGQRSLEWTSTDGSVTYLCFVHTGSVEQFQAALFGPLT